MENEVLKICRKLKQIKTRFQLEMSSIASPKNLEMRPPRSKLSTNKELSPSAQLKGQAFDITEDNITKGNSFEVVSDNTKSLQSLLQDFLPQLKLEFEKWGETFSECESFESLYPTRLDEIIRDAKCLEKQLMMQKETLKNRLKLITKTLVSLPSEDE